MKELYDTASQSHPLSTGDPVCLFNSQRTKGISLKLSRHWQGPYLVIKPINDLVYRIQLGPRTKPKVVYRNRLWKYTGTSPPTWLKDMDMRH